MSVVAIRVEQSPPSDKQPLLLTPWWCSKSNLASQSICFRISGIRYLRNHYHMFRDHGCWGARWGEYHLRGIYHSCTLYEVRAEVGATQNRVVVRWSRGPDRSRGNRTASSRLRRPLPSRSAGKQIETKGPRATNMAEIRFDVGPTASALDWLIFFSNIHYVYGLLLRFHVWELHKIRRNWCVTKEKGPWLLMDFCWVATGCFAQEIKQLCRGSTGLSKMLASLCSLLL